MAEIKFEIKQTLGILSESSNGWSKELNLVSWNDREPKHDLRDRAPDHTKVGRSYFVCRKAEKASGFA
jgi:hypothetical protein